jgi:hypothetical protein
MRYVGKDFPLQDPTETADLTIDFSRHPEWEKWDCILSVVTAVSVVDGTDAGSAARISGNPPTYCGSVVTQRFANPVDAVKYKLTATIVTRRGETLALYSNVTGQA